MLRSRLVLAKFTVPPISDVPGLRMLSGPPVALENIQVGNEAGVLGRYLQNLGHVFNEIQDKVAAANKRFSVELEPQKPTLMAIADAQVFAPSTLLSCFCLLASLRTGYG